MAKAAMARYAWDINPATLNAVEVLGRHSVRVKYHLRIEQMAAELNILPEDLLRAIATAALRRQSRGLMYAHIQKEKKNKRVGR